MSLGLAHYASLVVCLGCMSCGARASREEATAGGAQAEETPPQTSPNDVSGGSGDIATGDSSATPEGEGSASGSLGNGGEASSGTPPASIELTMAGGDRFVVDNCSSCHSEVRSMEDMIINRWLRIGEVAQSPAVQVLLQRSSPHEQVTWPREEEIAAFITLFSKFRD